MWLWAAQAPASKPAPDGDPDPGASGVAAAPSAGTSQSRSELALGWPGAAQFASTVPALHQLTGRQDGGLPLNGTCSLRIMPPVLLTSCISFPAIPQTAVY